MTSGTRADDRGRWTLLFAAALTLAACGSGGGEAAAPAAETAGSAGTETTRQSASDPPELELISVPWRLDSADGALLELQVGGAGCISFQNVEVAETAAKVTIEALAVRDIVTSTTSCDPTVTTEQAPTQLERPLGKRKLVHAPIDAEWPGPKTLGPDSR